MTANVILETRQVQRRWVSSVVEAIMQGNQGTCKLADWAFPKKCFADIAILCTVHRMQAQPRSYHSTIALQFRTNLTPSFCDGVAPLLNEASPSSQARPAPKPVPNHTGHALRLKRSTEKITPKEKPIEDRISRDDIAWSHLSLSRASLTGAFDRTEVVGFVGEIAADLEDDELDILPWICYVSGRGRIVGQWALQHSQWIKLEEMGAWKLEIDSWRLNDDNRCMSSSGPPVIFSINLYANKLLLFWQWTIRHVIVIARKCLLCSMSHQQFTMTIFPAKMKKLLFIIVVVDVVQFRLQSCNTFSSASWRSSLLSSFDSRASLPIFWMQIRQPWLVLVSCQMPNDPWYA